MTEQGTNDLPGGVIDTGPDPMERRAILPRWVKAMVAASIVLAAVSMFLSAVLFALIHGEINERRHRQCMLFERQEQALTLRVIRTYEYLDTLPAAEKANPSPLTTAVVRAVSDTYSEAQAARAPAYCNESGVGLPERKGDPVLPAPPRKFDHLLK